MHVIHTCLQNQAHSLYVVSLALKGSVSIFFLRIFYFKFISSSKKNVFNNKKPLGSAVWYSGLDLGTEQGQ